MRSRFFLHAILHQSCFSTMSLLPYTDVFLKTIHFRYRVNTHFNVNPGQPLTFPTTHSRWTERLQPGISSFSTIEDPDELLQQIRNYLEPLILFAKYVLRSKIDKCGKFPIYFKATVCMRY